MKFNTFWYFQIWFCWQPVALRQREYLSQSRTSPPRGRARKARIHPGRAPHSCQKVTNDKGISFKISQWEILFCPLKDVSFGICELFYCFNKNCFSMHTTWHVILYFSTIPQQKTIALSTLSRIIENFKKGRFDNCFGPETNLLNQLIQVKNL